MLSNQITEHVPISVNGLSKCYPIYEKPSDRLRQFVAPNLMRAIGRPSKQYYKEFWALKNISFDVAAGETVGIIGRNGSGKSTLLQMICGTLHQTTGHVVTRGRIAALLELGTGFNPEFTGRENVYMNAAVLGLSNEEIDSCYQDIVNFADIGEFIDQPVKTYSSGMMVRLAFAVQAQVRPDILIVDEALAVGDAKFQAKCFERLRRLKCNGTSILLVTHSAEQIVTHCSKAILLEKGEIIEIGEPRDVVNSYMDLLFGKSRSEDISEAGEFKTQDTASLPLTRPGDEHDLSMQKDIFYSRQGYNPHEYRWGDSAARILDFQLATDKEVYPATLVNGQSVELAVAIKFYKKIIRPIFGFTVKTREGVTVYGANSETLDRLEFQDVGNVGESLVVKVNFECRLAPGDYFISLGVASRENEDVIPHDRRYDSIHLQVRPNPSFFGLVDLDLKLRVTESERPTLC